MSETLHVTVNGRDREVAGLSSPAMLDRVLEALELRADRIAVELNGELTYRKAWTETTVKCGDKLEVVHFVGGGAAVEQAMGLPASRRS